MASPDPVYNPTTVTPENKKSKFFCMPNANLDKTRFFIKIAEVLLSFVAFVLEEVVTNCSSCGSLYFFEFVSCTAFLFTLLLVILLATPLHERVGISSWPSVDFLYTALIALFFLIASCVFAADNDSSNTEKMAVAFGFLASFAFLVDAFLLVKTKGFPFFKRSDSALETQPVPAPEREKLNTNGREAE